MRFESGMAGFLIIVLAISGSIFGTILLSAEESTNTVTKYEFETEITGLFETDTSPEFFDYDLSKNYTGYYTNESVINGVRYWGGALFTPTGVNNYPIKYEPEQSTVGSKVIRQAQVNEMTNAVTGESSPSVTNTGVSYYNKNYTTEGIVFTSAFASYTKSLSSFMSTLEIGGYDVIEIKSIYPTDYEYPDEKLLFFGVASDFHTDVPGHQAHSTAAEYVEYGYYPTYPQDNNRYVIACHSCRVDYATNTVSFYYNDSVSSSTYVRTVGISEAVVTFFGPETYTNPGITISVSQYNVNEIDYMDISQGVTVTGVTT